MNDQVLDPAGHDIARELERRKRSVFGLKDTIARQAVKLQLLRQGIAAACGLLRLLVDRERCES